MIKRHIKEIKKKERKRIRDDDDQDSVVLSQALL